MRLVLIVMSLLFAGTAMARNKVGTTPVLLPIAGVFAPSIGYDNNDNIQIVVDGVLPNSCWVIDQTDAKVTSVANEILVRQWARKQESQLCKNEESLPPELKMPVSFMAVVSVGVLPKGQYKMLYTSVQDGQTHAKTFLVEEAPTTEVDTLYYAITTDLVMPKVIAAGSETFEATISGYLSNPCSEMEEEVLVANLTDVMVLMPQVHRYEGACLPLAHEFHRRLTLKTPPKGRYLMQIRSANGNAVNRLFTVK